MDYLIDPYRPYPASDDFVWPESLLVYTLTFEGLQNLEAVLEFYNGGQGDLGSSGPNYGVYFSNDYLLGVIDADDGGSGNFANEPSPITAAYFYQTPGTMNSPVGLVHGMLIPFTTAIVPPGFGEPYPPIANAKFYRGLNGTGELVTVNYRRRSLYLGEAAVSAPVDSTIVEFPLLGFSAEGGDPTGDFQRWAVAEVLWAGEVKSVVFDTTPGVSADKIGFDDITFARNP